MAFIEAPMNRSVLLDKLTELELSIGVKNNVALRVKVIEAQDRILAMQKKMVGDLRRKSRLAKGDPSPASRYTA
jgi:hypothetical protein